jgi:hypothetical protein
MANPTTARQFIISALIFSAIIAGGFTLISLSIPAGAGNYTDYNRSFNKFATIRDNANSVSDSIEDATPSEGEEGILTGLYETSFGAIKQIWTSMTTMKTILSDLSTGGTPLPLPAWFTALLASIITVTVAFAIIASWRKWHT